MAINYLLVFLGGGLGSIFRFGIAHFMAAQKLDFPWATLMANVLACLVLGAIFALSIKNRVSGAMAFFIMTGFCGGFSTFSTFTNETFQLLANGDWWKAAANVLLSLVICLLSLFLGMKAVS